MLRKRNIVKLCGMGSLCLFLLGCSKESFLVQEENSGIILEEANQEQNDENADVPEDTNEVKEGESSNVPEEIGFVEEIAVHVCGAVKYPGVYYLKEDQRIWHAIEKAGGFREDANQDYLNQALLLEDGMKISVPTKEETALSENNDLTGDVINSESFIQTADAFEQRKSETQNEKIDLNTADEALLCTLPGIGESRAKSIIAYREKNGPFEVPEDIMKVSGIKEAAYEKIKNLVIVSR